MGSERRPFKTTTQERPRPPKGPRQGSQNDTQRLPKGAPRRPKGAPELRKRPPLNPKIRQTIPLSLHPSVPLVFYSLRAFGAGRGWWDAPWRMEFLFGSLLAFCFEALRSETSSERLPPRRSPSKCLGTRRLETLRIRLGRKWPHIT